MDADLVADILCNLTRLLDNTAAILLVLHEFEIVLVSAVAEDALREGCHPVPVREDFLLFRVPVGVLVPA